MWVEVAIGGWDRERVGMDLGNLRCKINRHLVISWRWT